MVTEHKKPYSLFIDAKPFQTDSRSITGAEIKQMAGITPTYQLFIEEAGDTPDRPIADSEAVDLEGEEKHFFAVPPATFGCL